MSRSVYVFDAYGTLLDVHSAVARYQDVIGPQAERLSELWRSKQLEYTWVRTLMGAYQDFAHLTEQALDYAAARCGGVSAQTRADLLNAYQTLNAYNDAAPCLRELRQRGARTGILSNGTPAMLQAAISAAGLTDLFDEVISVDELGIYKTAPVVYEQACQRFAVPAAELVFISSNRWDVAGASRFGCHSIWINRNGQADEYADCPPKAIYKTLDGLLSAPN